MFVPTKAFLSKGVGRHKEKLTSFEMALRDAHLANFNLVRVSSIFPPHCELVDREEGLSLMKPGQVVFAVIAEMALRDAHLANFNLVRVSSIFPPHCELVDREEGLSLMKPGQVVFAVIA